MNTQLIREALNHIAGELDNNLTCRVHNQDVHRDTRDVVVAQIGIILTELDKPTEPPRPETPFIIAETTDFRLVGQLRDPARWDDNSVDLTLEQRHTNAMGEAAWVRRDHMYVNARGGDHLVVQLLFRAFLQHATGTSKGS